MAYAALAIGFGIVIGILFIVRGETGSGLGMLGLAVVVAGLSFSSSASAGLDAAATVWFNSGQPFGPLQ